MQSQTALTAPGENSPLFSHAYDFSRDRIRYGRLTCSETGTHFPVCSGFGLLSHSRQRNPWQCTFDLKKFEKTELGLAKDKTPIGAHRPYKKRLDQSLARQAFDKRILQLFHVLQSVAPRLDTGDLVVLLNTQSAWLPDALSAILPEQNLIALSTPADCAFGIKGWHYWYRKTLPQNLDVVFTKPHETTLPISTGRAKLVIDLRPACGDEAELMDSAQEALRLTHSDGLTLWLNTYPQVLNMLAKSSPTDRHLLSCDGAGLIQSQPLVFSQAHLSPNLVAMGADDWAHMEINHQSLMPCPDSYLLLNPLCQIDLDYKRYVLNGATYDLSDLQVEIITASLAAIPINLLALNSEHDQTNIQSCARHLASKGVLRAYCGSQTMARLHRFHCDGTILS